MRWKVLLLLCSAAILLAGCAPLIGLWVGQMWYPRTFAVALGDLDGDGDLDAYIGNGHTDDTGSPDEVWLNQGDGTFHDSAQSLADPCCNSNDTRDLALADLDLDGDLDALAAEYNGYNALWANTGPAVFQGNGAKISLPEGVSTYNTLAVAVGDLNGDGAPDAVFADCCTVTIPSQPGHPNVQQWDPYLSAWLNDGQARFTSTNQFLGPLDARDLALGDLDLDGDLDILVAARDNNLIWWNGPGEQGLGTFAVADQTLGADGQALALGDVDADGDLDALIGGQGEARLWLNDAGRFHEALTLPSEGDTLLVALQDLNGDGILDAFIAAQTGAAFWLNDSTGGFHRLAQRLTYSDRTIPALGDVNGDGFPDVFLYEYEAGYQTWLNAGPEKNGQAHFELYARGKPARKVE